MQRFACILALAASAGCVSVRDSSRDAYYSDSQKFEFVVQSDPSGADIFHVGRDGERHLGTTPLVFPLHLVKRPQQSLLGISLRESWRAVLPVGLPLGFRSGADTLTVEIPEIELRLKSFEPETFSRGWRLPGNLRQRTSRWQSEPIPARYEETVIFRKPTAPHHMISVTIDSASGTTGVHAVNPDGGIGRLVGTTPLSRELGFARERSVSGEIRDWVRWHETDAELWGHTRDGVLLLNCFLVREGYQPVRLQNRPLVRIGDDPRQEHRAVFQLLRPTKPEAQFKVNVDSLPSDATVYAVREDGSLAQEIGRTPLEFVIGLAQESVEEAPGRYVHKDWRIWAPPGLVRWQSAQGGLTRFFLHCALYKEGFAVEHVSQPIFQLTPGGAYPEGTTLTVPLLSPSEAAARDARRLQESQARQQAQRPAGVFWQDPREGREQQIQMSAPAEETPEEPPSRWQRILRGIRRR